MPLNKPLMPACFLHWTEPPDAHGDEVFRLASWRRNLTLKGKSFRAFETEVVPLLTGENTINEICDRVGHIFRREDLLASLDLLAAQGIVVEGDGAVASKANMALTPQTGWLSEATADGQNAQRKLNDAHIVLFGAGAHGAACARALVAAGIGRLTIVDPAEVGPSDPYFSALFGEGDIGANRAEVLSAALIRGDADTAVQAHALRPSDADAVAPLISDATLVLCCLESGELNLALALNMACSALGKPWLAASLEGTELVVGPGFAQDAGSACYMCWRLREVAAAPNPITRYAIETHLGQLNTDMMGRRENLAPSADIVGGMLSAEALTWVSGVALPNLTGRFMTVELPSLRVEKHTVLRKPGCPVCANKQAAKA